MLPARQADQSSVSNAEREALNDGNDVTVAFTLLSLAGILSGFALYRSGFRTWRRKQISDRREFYNHSVNAHNVRIEQIPDLFVAAMMGLTPRELFEVDEEDRKDVKISFDR